ncbi:unnamed protein product [Phytophthora lilii]|uniref:Unnamed protein product n=1 Tax=Phytophthora lilii TaxID=2077276 RepID=A0A9W7CRB6_9STRA|nr:unnamed protein product [Phytophthora lilii]
MEKEPTTAAVVAAQGHSQRVATNTIDDEQPLTCSARPEALKDPQQERRRRARGVAEGDSAGPAEHESEADERLPADRGAHGGGQRAAEHGAERVDGEEDAELGGRHEAPLGGVGRVEAHGQRRELVGEEQDAGRDEPDGQRPDLGVLQRVERLRELHHGVVGVAAAAGAADAGAALVDVVRLVRARRWHKQGGADVEADLLDDQRGHSPKRRPCRQRQRSSGGWVAALGGVWHGAVVLRGGRSCGALIELLHVGQATRSAAAGLRSSEALDAAAEAHAFVGKL